MAWMTALKVLFVIMLTIPLAYLSLVLFRQLWNQLSQEARQARKAGQKTAGTRAPRR